MNIDFLNTLDTYIAVHRYRLINAVLVYENDILVFERYYNKFSSTSRNPIKSVWKSILSLVLGICFDKGFIKDIDEPIGRYLPPFNTGTHPYHSLITIRHLLTMSSGIYWNGGVHYHCPMFEQMRRTKDWVAHIADIKMVDFPGAQFVYKEWDVILLAAVIGKACGQSAFDFCNQQLYRPLGIAGAPWTQTKCGIDYPSYGIDKTSDLSAQDMAKIGLLMLHNGRWNDQQIISEAYIKTAVSPSAVNKGYGFFWWLSENDKGIHYHGRGFGGQALNVYPDRQVVAVVQATVTPSGKSYDDICENIIKHG